MKKSKQGDVEKCDGLIEADYELDMEGTVVVVGVAVRGDVKDMVDMEDTGRGHRPDPYGDFDDMFHSDYDVDPHHDPFMMSTLTMIRLSRSRWMTGDSELSCFLE